MRLSQEKAREIASLLNYRHSGLVIAVAQDYETDEVLMVAYMNREAVEKTLTTGEAHYWSTSRKKLWRKGEKSGHLQRVVDFYVDCDADAVLLRVEQVGAACHRGYRSCFHRKVVEGELLICAQKVFEPEEVYGGVSSGRD